MLSVTIECQFVVVSADLVRCQRCGRQMQTTVDPATIHARCKAPCVHRGEVVGTVKADCSCGARLHVATACELHGRCLPNFRPHGDDLDAWLARKPESDLYQVCMTCTDFRAAAAAEA